jgi:hypothetical protein
MENVNENETTGSATDDGEALGDAAYAQLLPEFQALSASDLIVINVDVPSVVALVVGSLPEIREIADDIAKVAPDVTPETIDRLKLYALALSYAHARYLSATSPADGLGQLTERGSALRETLLLDATALARRGLVAPGKLNELQGVVGYKNLAIDLTILASVLKDHWKEIQGKCAVTASEVEEALRIAERLFTAVGLKEQGPVNVEAATDLRLRAFTALAKAYDAVRRAVTFVRWKQGDAEKIAPSLYTGRSRRRAGSDVVVTPPVNPPPATPPADAPAAGAQGGAGPANAAPATGGQKSPESPGAEPFM